MQTLSPDRQRAVAEAASRELARRSLRDFCKRVDKRYVIAPHLALLIDRLEALERRDIRRLIVAMPPRHGVATRFAVVSRVAYRPATSKRLSLHRTRPSLRRKMPGAFVTLWAT